MEVVVQLVVIGFLICAATHVLTSSEQKNLLVPTPSLLVVTLDGNYYAVNMKNGQIKWTLKDEPTVTIPFPVSDKHSFLPDPKDGSLYAVNEDGSLRKLPFTIPELVTAAPCRSSDGILYTGRKVDVWYSIDMLTGAKHEVLSAVTGPNDKICPQITPYSIFMGKSEYTMTMYDGKTGERRWNVTYSCVIPHDVVGQYDLAHFTATSSGLIVTVDKETGSVLWLQDYKSPIVAMYALDHEGLHSVPFTSVASETLSYLTAQMALSNRDKLLPENTTLYPKLFIGRSEHGLYALPSLADDKVKNNFGPKLLPGPAVNNSNSTVNQTPEIKPNNSFTNGNSNRQYQIPENPTSKEKFLLVIGYYDIPTFSSVKVTSALQIGMELKGKSEKENNVERDTNRILIPTANQSDFTQENSTILLEDLWYNTIFVSTILALSISGFVYIVFKSFRQKIVPEKEVKVSPILQEGRIQIGKIEVDLHTILGKGCDGTCVYKGKYEGRDVAVKRILPDCFDFADREVTLLREADAHQNVIRYFSMEQDLQFRYLALELCAATVADYVENNAIYNYGLDNLTLLKQATLGLKHLHSLNIVHRDIKPQNVLISYPCNATGEAKVMISDFGLCKKLLSGRASFSKRSGSAGTEGWIAPEMMIDDSRMTCQVDIFSIGCIFYYVLTGGHHPFGDNLHRQSNILNGKYNLKHLTDDSKVIALHLVEKMISQKPEERPPCDAILKHPLFWTAEQQMDFLQDVSDRVEKEPLDSSVLIYLERNSANVVRGDWKNHIGNELLADLRQFRSYRGRSIRDLMRAIRNKKHHYRELTEDVKTVLGDTPSKFITYFTTRFPNLIPHVYYAMQCCKSEPIFNRYYTDYNFKLGFEAQDEGRPSFSPGGSPWHRNKMKKAEEKKEQLGAIL